MLKRFSSSDFPLLESWVIDADLLLQFSGTDFNYPLTEKQLSDYQLVHPDRKMYIGYSQNEIPFAFGEIIPQEGGQPRLGRILIGDPRQRGQGFGKYFIRMMVEECRRLYACSQVELFVWDKNQQAIKCYKSVGFEYLPEKQNCVVHEDVRYDIYKMIYPIPTENK